MNYYNPYFYSIPSTISTPKVGLLSKLTGGSGLTFGSILNGTQRALNFANQAIPLVKQVRPMIGNAKTMFRVMNEFKRTEKPNNNVSLNNNIINKETTKEVINNNINIENESNNTDYNEGPTFFI